MPHAQRVALKEASNPHRLVSDKARDLYEALYGGGESGGLSFLTFTPEGKGILNITVIKRHATHPDKTLPVNVMLQRLLQTAKEKGVEAKLAEGVLRDGGDGTKLVFVEKGLANKDGGVLDHTDKYPGNAIMFPTLEALNDTIDTLSLTQEARRGDAAARSA